MKQEILFRGFNEKRQKWIEGHYLVNRGKHYIVEDGVADPFATPEDFEVIPATVGQFTGLVDCNDVKMFKGDMVKANGNSRIAFLNNNLFLVEFKDGAFCLTAARVPRGYNKSATIRDLMFQAVWAEVRLVMEVVGNIHDNEDLI